MQTWWFVLGALGVAAGCYDPPDQPCTITCTESSGCPGTQSCIDGLCRGEDDVCTYPPLDWRSISVGATFACGITEDSKLYCWGNHRRGQLGIGPGVEEVATPRRVGTELWTAVSAGAEHACALRDGKAFCWGYNADGQVRGEKGSEFTDPQAVVIPLGADAPAFEHVSAGARHTCAIGAGQLWCWGNLNQVGVANVAATKLGAITDWTTVSAGYDHTCAISATAGLHCWGENGRGQVNAPINVGMIAQPTPIDVNGLPVIAVSAGDQTTCAIAAASPDATIGELWCWGRNNVGQIDTTVLDTGTPTRVGMEGTWSQVGVGNDEVCGIRDGLVRCWGRSNSGAIGNGIWAASFDESMALPILTADVVSLGKRGFAPSVNDTATFADFACARTGTKGYCWGGNQMGQLATGAPSTRRTPVVVEPPADQTWKRVWGGLQHVCAQTSTDELYCWGADYDGQISAGIPRGVTQPCVADQPCDYAKPTRAPTDITRVDDLVLGREYSCARDDTTIRCWGRANLGATPSGGIALPRAPMSSVWSKMWGGWYGTCGLTAVGNFACWGNVAGVNTNAPANQNSPELQNIDDVGVGDSTICAHRSTDNARVCWGSNGDGQVGNGTNLAQAAPQALGLGTVVDLAFGGRHGCAVTDTSGVACWGLNGNGQTGSAAGQVLTPEPVMTPVGALAGCTRVAAGLRHSCALCNGTIECWGDDNSGALGRADTSSTTNRVAWPIDLPGTVFTDVVARGAGTCGLTADGAIYCWGDGEYGGNGDGGQARNIPTEIISR